MPELSTHINAVAAGDHQIGIGTIVGSAIFNLCIIIGVSAWVRTCKITPIVIYREGGFYLLSVFLLIIVASDKSIQWWEPFVLFFCYIFYIIWLFHDARKVSNVSGETEHSDDMTEVLTINRTMAYVIGGILGIMILAFVIVQCAFAITGALNIHTGLFALLIIAVGTSIPDLFTSIQAARKGFGGLAVSNAIGSNTFDILVGMGLPLIFVKAGTHIGGYLGASMLYLLLTLVVTMVLLRHNWSIDRKKAVVLIGLYFSFLPVLWLETQGCLSGWL